MNHKTDHEHAADLLRLYAEASNRLDFIKAEIEQQFNDIREHYANEIAMCVEASEKTGDALEGIARRNPQWFEKKKSREFAHGTLKMTASTALIIPNENTSIALIDAAKKQDDFIKLVRSVKKETLEKLTDDELAKFGIHREKTDSFKIALPAVKLPDAKKDAKPAKKGARKAKR